MCRHVIARHFATLKGLLLTSALIGMPNTAAAINRAAITDADIALTPRYCAFAQSFPKHNTPERRRWEAHIGEKTFKHIHHYCWGLISLQRARRSGVSGQEKSQFLLTASNDIAYTIDRAAKNFVLLPEMLTRQGEVFLLRSLPTEANKSFAKARALKPDYWPAYSHWVEFLIYRGERTEAKRLVEIGLKYNPNAKVLREQYRLLSGSSSKKRPNRDASTAGGDR